MMIPMDSPRSKVKSVHYVDNKKFLVAITEYRKEVQAAKLAETEKPRVTEYIGECILKIATHLAYKPNFANYSYREDMISDAIENCLTYIDNFDPEVSSNPFAYFTQISYFAFVRRIQREKKVQKTKAKYIESLDLSEIITQDHDEGEYANGFITYLKKQVDLAHQEMHAPKEEKPVVNKRRPKYMAKKMAAAANSEVLPFEEDNSDDF